MLQIMDNHEQLPMRNFEICLKRGNYDTVSRIACLNLKESYRYQHSIRQLKTHSLDDAHPYNHFHRKICVNVT